MYQVQDVRKVIKRMEALFDSPVTTLKDKTELSRPTISKFFKLQPIRPSSVELLYELCLDLIEEKEKKRTSLKKRTDQLLKEVKNTDA